MVLQITSENLAKLTNPDLHDGRLCRERKMTGDFAFVAYPADHSNSGVMSFLVDQSGVICQKELGTAAADLAKAMTAFNRQAE